MVCQWRAALGASALSRQPEDAKNCHPASCTPAATASALQETCDLAGRKESLAGGRIAVGEKIS